MTVEVKSLESEAHRLLSEQEHQEASKLFSQAASAYQEHGQHQQAAFCFASAASCWALKAGEKALFYYAATCYEKAAKEAQLSGDFEYASTLYKHAGICYERDLEYVGFAECFYLSKECYRKYLSRSLFHLKKIHITPRQAQSNTLKEKVRLLASWSSLTFSSLLWGHGERPQRTIMFAGFLILAAAALNTQGYVLRGGITTRLNLFDAAYLSIVTFTHFGYSEVVPIGFTKGIAILEACFSEILILPIFITGLCRKYLRFI